MNTRNTYLIAVMLFLLASCNSDQQEIKPKQLRPVKYMKVESATGIFNESFSGIAQSSKEVQMSFKVSGTINRLNVSVGDVVSKGQVLAALDKADYSIQHQQSVANYKGAEAQVESSKSQLINAKSNYLRIEKLFENNSVSISEFEQAKSSYELALAAYEASIASENAVEQQVQSAENQLGYAVLKSPINGVVSAIYIEENEQINAGLTILTLNSEDNPQVNVGVPEVFISRISPQSEVMISFPSINNKEFKGSVTEVGFSSLGGSTYPVTIDIIDASPDIRPGMAAEAVFSFNATSASDTDIIVPPNSIGEDASGNFVFLITKSDSAYSVNRKSVTVGPLTERGFTIKSGLQKDDMIATAGLDLLLDGMAVKLLN